MADVFDTATVDAEIWHIFTLTERLQADAARWSQESLREKAGGPDFST